MNHTNEAEVGALILKLRAAREELGTATIKLAEARERHARATEAHEAILRAARHMGINPKDIQ